MTSFFDSAYRGLPPWDIGWPQAEFVRLAEDGQILGDVLDVGCGTGENAIYLEKRGHKVWGIDSSPTAIEMAKGKAEKRGSYVTFLVWDALALDDLKVSFDTVIDSGLFHIFWDPERRIFTRSLSSVIRSDGTYHMLCFSEREPEEWGGPRRVTQAEIRTTFRDGWRINYIREARFESNLHPTGGMAWLSSITRL